MTEVWTQWEGQVINGVFPLHRVLYASDHSAVFLTEFRAQNLANAALKLVPAIPTLAQTQLAHWRSAAAVSHPHLIRLLEVGRCQLGDLQFLFVVMEYAEQTLSQILPQRALTPGEVRDMLRPTLDALAFLHGKTLVQGQLKPSNILVVNDQVKLASDSVRAAGESSAYLSQFSVYDPPEARDGGFFASGDIWSLGVTLAEALTQHPPSWPDNTSEIASFAAVLPPPFADIIRQCLSRNPVHRPTVAGVEALINPAASFPAAPAPEPPPIPAVPAPAPVSIPAVHAPVPPSIPTVATPAPPSMPAVANLPPAAFATVSTFERPGPEAPLRAATLRQSSRPWLAPAIAALLIAVVAVWGGLRLLGHRTSLQAAAPPASASQPESPPSAPPEASLPPSAAKAADSKPAPSRPASRRSDQHAPAAAKSPSVLHEEIPNVSRRARNTIHGHIKIAVRVTVDSAGNVVDETLEKPGPSKYFARLAKEAARKWKFAPADNQDSRTSLLRFDFSRSGTTGHAAGQSRLPSAA